MMGRRLALRRSSPPARVIQPATWLLRPHAIPCGGRVITRLAIVVSPLLRGSFQHIHRARGWFRYVLFGAAGMLVGSKVLGAAGEKIPMSGEVKEPLSIDIA